MVFRQESEVEDMRSFFGRSSDSSSVARKLLTQITAARMGDARLMHAPSFSHS